MSLTTKEYGLLEALIRNRGRVVSRDELRRSVWRGSSARSMRTVDSHINLLRRKLGLRDGDCRHILTIPGIGYGFSADSAA